ncbi:large subunit GTPase 1 homolog isoform X1 [Harmonia axyridis]|uniref:large subunit GTPase 1 homolog isoform X1 n=2 Tax=Harmonia axyridis TaxID=115357 RepID=UPI001E27729B|nr:large subunit GTPase 1 homolog isoform X1 [Harmonia axyridis]
MTGKNKTNLGKALQKKINPRNQQRGDKSKLYTTELKDGYEWGRLNLQSVTEESSLQEFMSVAELARTEFKAEKLNCKTVAPDAYLVGLSNEDTTRIKNFHEDNKQFLRIPRRPKWSAETSPEELDEKEKDGFLEWRRSLALFQQSNDVVMTPFEKQLEFWRQLWRTIERSDVIVQIVDARNPLLFRCEDLEAYVKEVSENKINLLLVNKADFLTEAQRKSWANYFSSINVRAIFFSATLEKELENHSNNQSEESNDDEESEAVKQEPVNDIEEKLKNLEIAVGETAEKLDKILSTLTIPEDNCDDSSINSSNIFSQKQLIELFRTIHTGPKVKENITTIGFVGYPNVGKSSTLNSLLNEKKVSTSSTAGKTKHLQTIYLDTDILLCDCPGLVMPSFAFTKADLVINGILRIDEMRNHVPPITLVACLIPRHVIEDTYNIMIPKLSEELDKPPTAEEVLNAYAYFRGFMTANGQPDNARAARYILKDFQKGKLLYCYAPPDIPQESFHSWPEKRRQFPKHIPAKTLRTLGAHDTVEEREKRCDASGAMIMGKKVNLAAYSDCEKPWKKYNKQKNKNKREKLRKVYAHLDQH